MDFMEGWLVFEAEQLRNISQKHLGLPFITIQLPNVHSALINQWLPLESGARTVPLGPINPPAELRTCDVEALSLYVPDRLSP